MILVDLYLLLNASGTVLSTTSLLGQILMCPKLRYIKLIHVIKILLTVEVDTSNKWYKWSAWDPSLSLHMTIKNSSSSFKGLVLTVLASGSSVSTVLGSAEMSASNEPQ